MSGRIRIVGLLWGLGILACEYGEVGFVDLPPPEQTQLTLGLVADAPAAAAALGWPGGAIPGALVWIERLSPEDPWSIEHTTALDGSVDLADVAVGDYAIQVTRLLTPAERSALPEDGIVGFLHRGEFRVSAGGGSLEILVAPARPGSLVISEVKQTPDLIPPSGVYRWSLYIEIHNNADSTVYLDGKVLGYGFNLLSDLSPTKPCSMFDHLRVDPGGIWSILFERFPGSGQEHPLAAGQTAVVALEAIDHTALTDAPDALDLTGATFESFGLASPDNPQVPNTIQIGLRTHPNNRGNYWESGVVFLSEAVETASLARDREPDSGREWARIPAEGILDVMTHLHDVGWHGIQFPTCPQVIHPRFDRRWVHRISATVDPGTSLHRRPLLTLPDGRIVLQKTGSSYADFVPGPTDPGRVLQPPHASTRR